MRIDPEHLAYWYLRLNGFLTIPNFVVHPDTGRDQRTDVDLLGVRFPYRAELAPNTMRDGTVFTRVTDRAFIILAEVKQGRCALNGPWANPGQENLQRVLRSVGTHPAAELESVARALYTHGHFQDAQFYVSLACFGAYTANDLTNRYPDVPQILWSHVLSFIWERFNTYSVQKVSHGQWDQPGKDLWDEAQNSRDAAAFNDRVEIAADAVGAIRYRAP